VTQVRAHLPGGVLELASTGDCAGAGDCGSAAVPADDDPDRGAWLRLSGRDERGIVARGADDRGGMSLSHSASWVHGALWAAGTAADALLAAPFYMAWKLPMYFAFLFQRHTEWNRTARAQRTVAPIAAAAGAKQ